MSLGARVEGSEMKKFKPEVRRLVALARLLEWDVRWSGPPGRMAVMRSPVNPSKTLNIPCTSMRQQRWQAVMNQIITHSEPFSVRQIVMGGHDMVKEPDIAELVGLLGPHMVDFLAEEVGLDKPSEVAAATRKEADVSVTPIKRTAVGAAMEEAQQQAAARSAEKAPEPKAQEPQAAESDHGQIVSERPWLARSGGTKGGQGKVYESQGVLIVTYSDGTEVYKCKFCDFTHPDNPRSVKMHAANRKAFDPKHQDIAPKVLLRTDHYEPTDETRPGRTAIAHLRADLIMALSSIPAWQQCSAEDLADTAAHLIVENRPDRHVNTQELTPEQVLARVTALVDGGRLADLHRQVEVLSNELRDAVARRDKAEGDIDALRELLGRS